MLSKENLGDSSPSSSDDEQKVKTEAEQIGEGFRSDFISTIKTCFTSLLEYVHNSHPKLLPVLKNTLVDLMNNKITPGVFVLIIQDNFPVIFTKEFVNILEMNIDHMRKEMRELEHFLNWSRAAGTINKPEYQSKSSQNISQTNEPVVQSFPQHGPSIYIHQETGYCWCYKCAINRDIQQTRLPTNIPIRPEQSIPFPIYASESIPIRYFTTTMQQITRPQFGHETFTIQTQPIQRTKSDQQIYASQSTQPQKPDEEKDKKSKDDTPKDNK